MINSEVGVGDCRYRSDKFSIITLQASAQPILKDADLSSMSAKKVRQQIEEKLDIDLTERFSLQELVAVLRARVCTLHDACSVEYLVLLHRKKEDASDEEYSPKKGKGASPAKKGKAGGKKKKRGSDSDSGEDWAKTSRGSRGSSGAGGQGGPTPKKGGAKRAGGGYTRAYTLSPELASVVGQDSMARHEVVKKIWAIIKEKNLYVS
uniref:Uncharacterized protein n=1 Tax=Timema genevievae TaxID=629358 RepID=A0A7R9K1K4_TIMGE|nr:unnamed protein product [Timema genevievae]